MATLIRLETLLSTRSLTMQGNFNDDVAVVKLSDKFGLIDAKGSYIVNPIYPDMSWTPFSGCLYFANDDGKLDILTYQGKRLYLHSLTIWINSNTAIIHLD